MYKEIDNLIYLIESDEKESSYQTDTTSDSILYNADKTFSGYNPSPGGIVKAFLKPGTEVLFIPNGGIIESAIKCKVQRQVYDENDPNRISSYQPSRTTKELDRAASFREQGPVYKSEPVGPRLYGRAAFDAYKRDLDPGAISLHTEDGKVINTSIYNRELSKKSITRNKKKYHIIYVTCSKGTIVLKVSEAKLDPAATSARSEKIRTNKLNRINAEIEQLEKRLNELKVEKEKLEKKR